MWCSFVVLMKCFYITSGINSMWNVQNEWCLDVLIMKEILKSVVCIHANSTAQHWPAESDLSPNVAPIVPQHFLWEEAKKKKKKLSDRFIEDVCHCRFYPASRSSSGAIWGLFYWFSEDTSQLLPKHTHTNILLDKNSHPFAKKWDKSHQTRYGHTNQRTIIQIFMKCFPNVNI